jgi:hypothetical protein
MCLCAVEYKRHIDEETGISVPYGGSFAADVCSIRALDTHTPATNCCAGHQ